jgi:hypothetical protein
MKWQKLLVANYQRMTQEVEHVLDGLTVEDIHKRPSPGANPIGWLIWHVSRSMDRTLGDVVLGQQLWISGGWHKKFSMPPNPLDTGYAHSDAQVDALKIPDVKTLLDYYHTVMDAFLKRIETLTEADLDKEYPSSIEPGAKRAFYLRITSNMHDMMHVGQAGYVRGLIKGHGWYGR